MGERRRSSCARRVLCLVSPPDAAAQEKNAGKKDRRRLARSESRLCIRIFEVYDSRSISKSRGYKRKRVPEKPRSQLNSTLEEVLYWIHCNDQRKEKRSCQKKMEGARDKERSCGGVRVKTSIARTSAIAVPGGIATARQEIREKAPLPRQSRAAARNTTQLRKRKSLELQKKEEKKGLAQQSAAKHSWTRGW